VPNDASRDAPASEVESLRAERDQYKRLYLETLELCRKLERGILGQKREKLSPGEEQLSLALLGMLLSKGEPAEVPAPVQRVAAHERTKPTGRKPLPEKLPRVDIEVLPPEVQSAGLDAFERIGEDVCETVERRPSSLVVVRVHKPKFVPKGRDRFAETKVLQAEPPELPIPRGLAGPGLLADTIVRRWQDHLPLHRQERIYGREGLELARSTICGWHDELAKLLQPLLLAMWRDALAAPYLCTDATGVLVQAQEKCRAAHFFVVAAPEKHVLFAFTPRHNSEAIDRILGEYRGYLVADAATIYDHLFKGGKVVEVGCWAHVRRYFYKALTSDPERARPALAFIGGLFQIEREQATSPPADRLEVRRQRSRPIVDAFFAWADEQAAIVLDQTPISAAIQYARNQRKALQRFLEDGRLPLHNNLSERELRREAVGRKNWLFVGSDDGGEANATFASLLASCQLHGIEPLGYVRDLLCLLPGWPASRVLDLSPANWQKTVQQQDAQQRLAANVFRQISLGANVGHHPTK
jgi:transposase